MSFLTNLGKGFIRSAVNQVGRDTGKVISNSIYGDAHATPIRNVSKTDKGIYVDNIKGEEINLSELRNRAEKDGWVPNYSTYNRSCNNLFGWIVKVIIWIIAIVIGVAFYPFSLMLPVVPLILLINGTIKLFGKTIEWQKEGLSSIYVSDRRYKGGYRSELKPTIQKVNLPKNNKDKKISSIYGIIDIILAIIFSFGAYHYGEIKIKEIAIHECEMIISQREQIFNDSIREREDIEWWKKYDKDTYKSKLDYFIKKYDEKYQEYIDAVNKLDSIRKTE